mgnify:CR=1 FL=1
MEFQIEDNINLKYESSENFFAGLVIGVNSDISEIYSIYEQYIHDILRFSLKKNVSYKEIIEYCSKELKLNDTDIDDIKTAFDTFFLYDHSTGTLSIKFNVELSSSGGKKHVCLAKDKSILVSFDSAQNESDNDDGENKVEERDPIKKKAYFKCLNLQALHTFFTNNRKKTALGSSVFLLFALVIIAQRYWPITPQEKNTLCDTIATVQNKDNALPFTFNVIDNLLSDGELIIEENESINVQCFYSQQNQVNIDAINWDECDNLSTGVTLRPKESCTIVLRASLHGKSASEASEIKLFRFDMPSFIKDLIRTNSHTSIREQLFAFDEKRPLTIEYDSIAEYSYKNKLNKGLILDELYKHLSNTSSITYIEFYSYSHPYKNKIDELESEQYPVLKYIECK